MSIKAIKVTVNKQVTRDQLVAALDKYLHKVGCAACGLLGHGFYLEGDPDPVIGELRTDFEKIKGFTGVSSLNVGVQEATRF